MCFCEKLIISFVFCAICCTDVVLSVPNAWPKMRNYDIWGPKSTKSLVENDSFSIENAANITSSRDGRVTATCEQEVFNNITYIVSPSFPALMSNDVKSCKLKIKMISPDISQLRLDFVHFSIGQPNRRTGICDGDIFSLTGGIGGDFILCGQNNGQHIYYDVPGGEAMARQEPSDIELFMNFTDRFASTRLWEIRIAQIPFSQRAPTGCLQYFTSPSGIIQTFNFAENGRHLANQNYRSCIRQETGMCSIAYEPCTEQSFRIGQREPANFDATQDLQDVNTVVMGDGVGPVMDGGVSSLMTVDQAPALDPIADPVQAAVVSESPVAAVSESVPDQVAAADTSTADDAVEGSGGDAVPAAVPAAATTGFFSSLPSFQSFFSRRIFGYRQSRQFFTSQCNDRITMPCIVEDFIAAGMGNVPDCTPIHCGNSLCAPGVLPCRVESTVTPFGLGIRFGDGLDKGSPEDNIGACLRFN
ncbi:hypothetical protein Bhyg_04262, partial [Pseudolycoriella hygida]